MHLYTPHMFFVILFFCLAAAAFPCSAAPADDGSVVYSTDFTNGDGWITNSKDRFYPEVETGRYHYLLEGGTGGYSAYALPQKVNGQFILEFDVTPEKTDDGSTFRFGIGTDKKDSQRGPLLMVELANKKDGRLFYLKTVSKENSLNLIGSSPSTGSSGSTVRFEDNTTYHVKLTYYAADSRASIVVQEQGSPDVIFTASAPVSGKMEDLTQLYLTSIGDGTSGPQAEGYIDNIKLTLPTSQAGVSAAVTTAEETADVTPAPVSTTTTARQTDEPTPVFTPGPTRTPFPLPPTPTPTQTQQSGSGFLILFPALAGGAILALKRYP
ncbi:hypothetical protein [Methanospirillum lacunae]|uniref:DUF3821 domain-containing protein n=2 Tax=Methanospirillum lacunae TaxID=668570 RepID=A0A2V2MV71_9EURY|nr:hypothetical protein [Methanospirillum lacunae]PWR72064.1 hypothetical protein DK846_08730 [Methanospirillum lacunae]